MPPVRRRGAPALRDKGAALSARHDRAAHRARGHRRLGHLRLRHTNYTEADVAAWADRVQAQPWDRAFVFFKHEDEARGPEFAGTFAQRVSAR